MQVLRTITSRRGARQNQVSPGAVVMVADVRPTPKSYSFNIASDGIAITADLIARISKLFSMLTISRRRTLQQLSTLIERQPGLCVIEGHEYCSPSLIDFPFSILNRAVCRNPIYPRLGSNKLLQKLIKKSTLYANLAGAREGVISSLLNKTLEEVNYPRAVTWGWYQLDFGVLA